MVFTADEAESRAQKGEAIILVRVETSPEDIHGMNAARGILTTRGGMTSHAAVVARGMGRPCVAGAGGISIDYTTQTLSAGRQDGARRRDHHAGRRDGRGVHRHRGDDRGRRCPSDFATLMEWADKARRMKVRANAETPLDAETAKKFGADGIGLCRTEHMFFDPERISAVRQMIMAPDEAGRRTALARLLPFQRDDFQQAVPHHGRSAGDHPAARSAAARIPAACARRKWRRWRGRWARTSRRCAAAPRNWRKPTRCWAIAAAGWAISYPEIYEMQARAIFEGALAVAKETGTRAGAGDHDPAGGRD